MVEWDAATLPVPGAGKSPVAATKAAPFVNSLGMKYVPVAKGGVLFSVWETRNRDYAAHLEWSTAAGLHGESGASPRERGKVLGDFAWGTAWPPPPDAGNFAGEDTPANTPSLAGKPIVGYRDGFAITAPVGSFPANAFGIHDLSGNANEWVADLYGAGDRFRSSRTLRGGGWNEGTNQFPGLRVGFRFEGNTLRRYRV